ncbi:MAG TPA: Ig-like domain-containing protein [Blastocatellia bacterium]|nr:Ig-like domain-containing protein [Blastocatellia bacterium]
MLWRPWVTPRASQNTVPVSVVSAAGFDTPVAPESISVAFGSGLAKNFREANTQPLPTVLDGTTVVIRDSAGVERSAPLFVVSPTQINFLVPAGTAQGKAGIVVRAGDGVTSMGEFTVAAVAPGIFTANASGAGVPAAQIVRGKADGTLSYESLSQGVYPNIIPKPIDLGPAGEIVVLVLYATGLKNARNTDGNLGNGAAESVRVLLGGIELTPDYVAPSQFVGVEQVNVLLPRSLVKRGRVNLSLAVLNPVSSKTSNQAEIEIAGPPNNSPPVIERVNILSGETGALVRDRIEILGQGFSAIAKENTVRVGNIEALVEEASPGRLLVRVPFGSTSAVVSVITPRGEGRSAAPLRMKTSVSGSVKDTRNQPIRGVKVSLLRNGKTAFTNDEGVFILPDVPSSLAEWVEVDGSSVGFTLAYPDPPVKIRIEENRDNTIESPVYLQQKSGVQTPVSSTGNLTDDSPLTLIAAAPDQTTGEIRFNIAAGTRATFPDGRANGTLVLNAVENGLTPVRLPDNVFSSSIAQIANFGIKLNPGGKLSFPNSDRLPPGTPATLYKYEVARCAEAAIGTPACRRGEWIPTTLPVTVNADTIETGDNVITETSYYFVAAPRPTTAAVGRVVEDVSDVADKPPVRGAVVRVRGQEAVTDGNGGFVVRGILANAGDKISAEVSWIRPDGRVYRQQGAFVDAVVNGLTGLGEIRLETEATNRAPFALVPSVINLTAERELAVTFSAGDPEGQPITVSVNNPRIAQVSKLSENLYSLRLTPSLSDVGEINLRLTVRDNLKEQNYDIRLIVRVPLTARAANLSTDEDQPLNLTLAGNDPEGKPLSFVIVSNPANGTLEGSGSARTYKPNLNYYGTDRFTFYVSNGFDRSDEATVAILIRAVNDPPVLTVPTGAQSVNPGELSRFTVSAGDPDSDNLKITASNLPAGAGCPQTGNSCQFNWTPTGTQTGSYQILFRVEDDDPSQRLFDEKTVTVTVVNRPPVLRAVDAKLVDEGKNLSFTLLAEDPDAGQSLTFSSDNLPENAGLNPNGQFNWTPGFAQAGSYSLNVTVTDNGSPRRGDNGVVRITVNNVNRPPVASGQNVVGDEDTQLEIALDAADPDGDPLRFTILSQPASGVLLGDGKTRLYKPNLNFNGSDSFTYKVSDGSLESNTAVVNVRLRPVNDPPVLILPGAQQATVGEVLKFTVKASDVDGDTVRLGTPPDLPTNAVFNPATGEFSWTPGLDQRNATPYKVTFTATDNGSPALSDSRVVEIAVNEQWRRTNGPPGANVLAMALSDFGIFAGTEGGIYVSENNGASWRQLEGLRGFTIRALLPRQQRIFAGTENGVYVSDDNGASWRRAGNGLPAGGQQAAVLALAADNQNQIFAGTYGGGVFVTTNGGANWASLSEGLPVKPGTANKEVYSLVAVQGRLLAGTNEGVYALTPGAPRWLFAGNGMPGAPHTYSLLLNGNNVYAATNDGVFLTSDNGANWRMPASGLPADTAVTSIAVSGLTVFAGTYGGGVYALGNNSPGWASVNNGLAESHVLSLLVLGDTLFAGTEGAGVFAASAAVAGWKQINNGLTVPIVLSLAGSGANLFAGTYGGGVYVSANNGANWTQINGGLAGREVYSLAVNGTRIFAGTNDGVSIRDNGSDSGVAWSPSANGMPGAPHVYTLAVSGGRVWAGTNDGVFVTANNGASWTRLSNGLPNDIAVTALAVTADRVFAGTYGRGIFTTANQGASWTAVNQGLSNSRVLSLAAGSGRLFAGTEGGGLFISLNNGGIWRAANAGLPADATVITLLVNGQTLWAGLRGEGVYAATGLDTVGAALRWTPFNNGLALPASVATLYLKDNSLFAGSDRGALISVGNVTTWRQTAEGMFGAKALALTAGNAGLVAGTYGGGAFLTTNEGADWSAVNNGLARNRVFALFSSGELLLAGTNDGVYASTDRGANWAEANNGLTGLPQVYAFAGIGSNVFAAANSGVFVSGDNGLNWTAVSNGLPSGKAILSLTVSGNLLFAGTYQGGLFVSANQGASWSRADNGIPIGAGILALAVSGANVLAGTDKGLFVSKDNGANWGAVGNGLPAGLPVTSLAVSGNLTFAGTYGAGVFVSNNNGLRWAAASRGILTPTLGNPINPAIIVSSLAIKQGVLFAGINGQGVFALKFL